MSLSMPSARQWKHDVFLSFRGPETRYGFVSHLYDELESTGITTFMDEEELEVGKPISPNLLMAIEESRFSVVVLSPDYASSPWCLDELTKILQSMEGRDRILPIFYHVDPSHVRHQLGSFAEAFAKHEKSSRQSKEKLDQWRLALKNVADLSGWDAKNMRSERELVKRIVKFIRNKMPQVSRQPIPIEFKGQPAEDFESTTRARDELTQALKYKEITVIGVFGEGGVGKRTMVKHVSTQVRELRLFHYVIRAVVAQTPEFINIQDTLADQLGLKFEEKETDISRTYRLKGRIMGVNKILIVLVDVWRRFDLSTIGIPNYSELQTRHSKLILTSRSRTVCYSMQCQASIPLHILSDEDSWNFFLEKLGKSFEKSTEMDHIARTVAEKCGGLPLALIMVAWALKDRDIDEWRKAAHQLYGSQTEGDVYKCVKFSYDYLISDAKSIFLLCCLFPEDYDIPIEYLLKYAIGKGLLQDLNTIQESRAKVDMMIKSLKASGLLLEGTKEGCVRMHDVVRDVAMSISLSENDHKFFVKAGCELQNRPKINAHGGYSAISLMRNKISKLPGELVCSNLQILLLQNNGGICEIPNNFFQSIKGLMVLDLSFTSISSLPASFSLLTNLKGLYLDYCNKFFDISIFVNLKKLEFLSMKASPLEEFPKEIENLTSLRMLDLSGSYNIGRVPSKVLSSLHTLEELYMQGNFGDWGGGQDSINAGFDELTSLKYLNIVKVRISDEQCLPENVDPNFNWEHFDICISRESPSRDYSSKPYCSHDLSRTLTLSTTINNLPDWFIKVVAEKAEKLQYLKCRGLKNVLAEHDKGRLFGLKYLAVIGPHDCLEVLMETITQVPKVPVFKNLEELHLLGVSCLKELCVGELPHGSLLNLKSLKVEYCHDLMNTLLQSNLLQRLHNLEKLHCEDMNVMEYVFGFEGLEPEGIILPKLREMILWDLDKLISIWNGPVPITVFQNLKSLAVSGCQKLTSLFTYEVAESLLQLEDLSVTQCADLGMIIEPSKEVANKKIIFQELKKLALSYLPQLTRFCGNGTAFIECPSLEHLHLQDCPVLATSISDFHCSKAEFQVNDLRHLRMSKDMEINNLAGKDTKYILESLSPNVRKRVDVIREIEKQHHELEAEFLKERSMLEARYQKLLQPLYSKRYLIVNGIVEAEGVAVEAEAEHEIETTNVRGVPDFWLNAMKNDEVLAKEIAKCDGEALKYLRDIKVFKIYNSKGFKLEFSFDANPFFRNSVLIKTYHVNDEDEPYNATGTEIEWYPGKCLTRKILKKKHKKGSKRSNYKPVTGTAKCRSFFNFFSPLPQMSKEDEADDTCAGEELKNQKKHNYDVGSTICYKIVPNAVSWFTGEAASRR